MNNLTKGLSLIKERKPLVHHITNVVTVNGCANMTLAIGAAPVMSNEIKDVEGIVSISSALVINTGTITNETFEAMIKAGKKANELGIPVILDPVGIGATKYRLEVNTKLINEVKFSVIRGNYSEIMTLVGIDGGRGVDAELGASLDEKRVIEYSLTKNVILCASGAVDFITDGNKKAYCKNGTSLLSEITGTGCMSTSLIGSCLGASINSFDAAVLGTTIMGIAGEYASEKLDGKRKLGSFNQYLLDGVSTLDEDIFVKRGNIVYE